MTLWETVSGWADSANGWIDRSINALPNVGILSILRASNQTIATVNDIAKAPAEKPVSLTIADGMNRYTYGSDLAQETITVADVVGDTAQAVGDFVGITPGSVPLWLKLTVAGALVVGTVIMFSGVRRNAQLA